MIDTVGIKTTVPGYQNIPHSDQMRITERIRLVAADVLHDQITISDPVVLEKPCYTLAYSACRATRWWSSCARTTASTWTSRAKSECGSGAMNREDNGRMKRKGAELTV